MLYIPDLSFIEDDTLINQNYTVSVNGKDCTVRACRVSAMPFNRAWPGYQRNKNQTEIAGFINIFGDEEIELTIRYNGETTEPIVRPVSKNITVENTDNAFKMTLKENGYYVFEPNGEQCALHIFYNEYKEYEGKENATYYFGRGVHKPLLLNLKDNDTVYVDPEAIVFASVYAENAKNVRIFGGGVIDNSCQERVSRRIYKKFPLGNIRMWDSSDITIEDVTLVDSSCFVLSLYYCENITIDSVKLVGHWRYNTDGIDLLNCKNAVIKNSFVRSFDDGIVIKAIFDFDICENISVENCTVWCGWGKSLELGLETAANEYKNISFKNCQLIHNSTGAMAISNGHSADIHDISYENIAVEFQKTNRPQVLQESDESVYEWDGKPYMENLIKLGNWQMTTNPMYKNSIYSSKSEYGHTHDIYYKNIYVYTDYDIGKLNITIRSEVEKTPTENINIENIYLNSKLLESFEEFNMFCKNVNNVKYNGRYLPEKN